MIGLSPLSAGHPPSFQPRWVRPSTGSYPASACPWIAHPASRLRRATARPVRTRSRYGSLRGLASPRTATRWLILQKARRHSHEGCSDCLWARGFRCCFTPLPGCFSPFPHGTMRYRSISVFCLGGWSPRLPTGFLVSRGTLVPSVLLSLSLTWLSHPLALLPRRFG